MGQIRPFSALRNYQHTCVEHIVQNDGAGLFLGMAMGKTAITLTSINELMYERFEINRVLIVAPKRVAELVWHEEVKEWEHLQHLRVQVVKGAKRKRDDALRTPADVYTIGVDNFAPLVAEYGGKLPFDMLILDESSMFKNPSSKRFSALKACRPYLKRVVILTGTPAPRNLEDIWAQIYALDMGRRLCKSLTAYRNSFFRLDLSTVHTPYKKYEVAPGSKEDIFDRIKDIVITMKSEDYLTELPSIQYIDTYVEFDEALRAKYEEFERKMVLELFEDADIYAEDYTGGAIFAASAAALSNKLLQFTSGAVYDDQKVWHEVHDLKLQALREFYDAADEPNLLVARGFKHEQERIEREFKKYGVYTLDSSKDPQNDWNAGKWRSLVMHPASGGHGLNLQHGGSTIIWYSVTWNLEHYQQLNKRLHRPGQKDVTRVYRIIAKGTIDERVVQSLNEKDAGQNELLDATSYAKELIKKYLKK